MQPNSFLEDIVTKTRQLIWQEVDAASYPAKDTPSLAAHFKGCCGLAQCIAGYALQDRDITVQPIATQSLKDYRHGHAALSVTLTSEEKTQFFLVDPTFQQFYLEDEDDKTPPPALYLLSHSEEGRELAHALIERGYADMNPQRAQLYFSSFCQGKSPFDSAEQAFAFFKNPPPHPYHFRRDIDDDSFSRPHLKARGLVIT